MRSAARSGGWSKTPTEKALRLCIQEAVKFIVSKTPADLLPLRSERPARGGGGAEGAGRGGGHRAGAAATAVAATAPADATGTPSALKVLKSIRADMDKTWWST